jgi:drug/metabolite transporter (DMT)-like permease
LVVAGLRPTVWSMTSVPSRGVLLCLASSAGFGAMAVLAKDAYAAGVGVLTLVALRLLLAAPFLWATAGALRLPRPSRRDAGLALLVGAGPFAAQALTFFAAVERLDAAVAELLVFTYPAIVLLATAALRRVAPSPTTWAVLSLALSGAALVLLGGGAGPMDALGVALSLAAAVAYAGYLMAAEGIGARIDGVVMAALVTTGAGLSALAVAALGGGLDLGLPARGWLVIAVLAVLCTAGPLVALYAGLRLVGASTASILSLVEPVVTVVLAAAFLGERLAAPQLAGAGLVLAAVLVVARPAPAPGARPLRSRRSAVTVRRRARAALALPGR